jgi:hypothetical protein
MLAIAGLGSGCYSSSRSGDVTIYWEFSRNLVGGGSQGYDTNVSPGGGSASCPQSGADYVVVTFLDGSYVDPSTPTLPCVYNGVQGATFLDFARGPTTFVVTGYRNGVPNPLYTGQGTVDVVGGANNPVTIVAGGIPDDLDLFAYLYSTLTNPPSLYASCAQAGVSTITYTLVDGAGTTVDSRNNVACTGTLPALFLAEAVDRDNYTVRAAAYTGATQLFDSCSFAFDHFGSQVGGAGVAVPLDNPLPTCR